MPSPLPSSFASAAAGQSANRMGRADARGNGSGEWLRREGRPTNGTLTFRRSTTTPSNQNSQQQPVAPASSVPPSADAPPMESMAQLLEQSAASLRYSKDQLLEIYKSHMVSAEMDVSTLVASGWNPGHVNGTAARAWGKSSDTNLPQDPGVCWDNDGHVRPIGLEQLSPAEKELFSSDVNSPLKLTQQNKDGNQGGLNGRKASMSHGSNQAVSSPSTASRPSTRRRETTDTNPFPGGNLASPTAVGRFSRDDPSGWFGRKSLDTKEEIVDEPEEEDTTGSGDVPPRPGPFGAPARSNTTGNVSFANASSLWGQSSTAAATAITTATTPGMGSFGNFALPTSTIDRRFGSTRGESRLAHLIPKEGPDHSSKPGEAVGGPAGDRSWRPRPRTDTDPFGGDDGLVSSVINSRRDTGSPSRMQPSQRSQIFDTPVKGSTGDFGMSGLAIGSQSDAHGPSSPSQTNPYRSPPAERGEDEQDECNRDKMSGQLDQPSAFGSLRGYGGNAFEGSDRSQTSSTGPKPYSTLGNLTGWPSGPTSGTPDRERSGFASAFGSSLFSPMGDIPSPGLGGMSSVFGPAGASGLGGSGSIRGSSKLGSLFPAAMQAQMQNQDQDHLSDSLPDLSQGNPLGAIGRGAIGQPPRDSDSPMRPGRGAFEDLFPGSESTRSPNLFTTGDAPPASTATAPGQGLPSSSGSQSFSANQSGDPPSAQSRTMVMPDRMRWVYLDPQGQIQGPFTGLEMNDWYKGRFFTPDLRVKKLEDPEFEPLGQLIRRIGNSREPFLVPQIGIPHGPPPAYGPFGPSDSHGGVVPPLMGAFPSYGRTLTAEEQNNLERRKQEEQYLMARQREFLAQQQSIVKLQMPPGGPGSLHHHSSAHSLQSQPSFGSITSPGAPGQPPLGAIGGPSQSFFDGQAGMSQAPGQSASIQDLFRDEFNPQERQILASISSQGGGFPGQPVGGSGESALRGQLPTIDQLQHDPEGFSERLHQFQQLRAQREAEEAGLSATMSMMEDDIDDRETQPLAAASKNDLSTGTKDISEREPHLVGRKVSSDSAQLPLSLTQQVQKAQAAKQAQTEDVWNQQAPISGMPMPFPPPPSQSSTPLPAPTAQRSRSTLPEQYADNRSQTETPESAAAPPPLAPWARDPGSEAQKGPSLKEIQEAEAKKAAKAEEAAATARRAALEQEAAAIREREKATVAALATGLPTTSTWGNGSPISATSATSAWAKAGTVKVPAPGLIPVAATAAVPQVNDKKKTLADIQREEEARKMKAKEVAQQHSAISAASALGKRYAELASKGGAPIGAGPAPIPISPAAGGGWATVGAGGKVKIPTGPAAQTRAPSSGNVAKATPPPVAKPTHKSTSAVSVAKSDTGSVAMDEFNKWLHRELGRGITGGIDIETFAATLLILPLDRELISEVVYANSTTMDGRHFAEEFIRRKKLADKGVVEKQPTPSGGEGKSASSGGWSEVAKKGGNASQASREDGVQPPAAGFKVVPGRKKGKK